MYDITFSDKAKRDLFKLDKNIQERIGTALERIRVRPDHFVEKLVGEEGFKFRVGDYRIILDLDNKDLIILVIELGHRRNIYKR